MVSCYKEKNLQRSHVLQAFPVIPSYQHLPSESKMVCSDSIIRQLGILLVQKIIPINKIAAKNGLFYHHDENNENSEVNKTKGLSVVKKNPHELFPGLPF